MVRLTFDVYGTEQVKTRLTRAERAFADLSPAWREARKRVIEIVAEQFDTEGGRARRKWAPLAPSTVAQRGSAHPILVDTGRLRRAMTSPGGGGFHVRGETMRVSWRPPEYGAFHQRGTMRMPARPMVDLTRRDRREIVRIVRAHLLGQRAAGGYLSFGGV